MTIVRSGRPEDFEQWAPLYRDYRAFYRLVPDEVVVERVWSWVVDDEHEVNALVAEDEGRLVGVAHHRRFARPSSGTTGLYLDDLFTLPAYRGRGVGRALLGALADLAEAEGLSVVRWITAEDNAQARRLYDARDRNALGHVRLDSWADSRSRPWLTQGSVALVFRRRRV